MKVLVRDWVDREGCLHEKLYINGKEVESAHPLWECPEDATLERDMLTCSDIVRYMKLAYNAGLDATGIEFSTVSGEEE